jgi:hypothetical protein
MNQEIKLARKNYNHEFNFQEYNPQDFEGQEIACENCGVVSSDDS